MVVELKGTGCYSVCAVAPFQCKNGDGCCPPTCTIATDSDCPAKCGDGIIQADRGETCEPPSLAATLNGLSLDQLCTTRCEYDGDPCTREVMSGGRLDCTARCIRQKITSPQNGDRCCPPGADANLDDDCKPVCGNKIAEPGEECDGSTGCDNSCNLTAYQRCIESLKLVSELLGGATISPLLGLCDFARPFN
jgi:hypothetical protein